MSNDLVTAITGFLSNGWRFFTEVTIPTTNITMGQLAIALILVPIALRFMGIMLNIHIGDAPDEGYGKPKSTALTISNERHLDTR